MLLAQDPRFECSKHWHLSPLMSTVRACHANAGNAKTLTILDLLQELGINAPVAGQHKHVCMLAHRCIHTLHSVSGRGKSECTS
jgi:hypothetical protein